MAKGGNSLTNKRSRGVKPYDANNSFVKKVATKVTDLIPQSSWISKWFNSSQDNGEMLNDDDNEEDSDNEQEQTQPPPSKRPRIRMDVTHPPGTFNIQPRNRNSNNEVDPRKQEYSGHNETTDDFLEPPVAGTSGTRRLVASTPAIQPETRNTNAQGNRANFISLTTTRNNGATNGTDDNSESSESTSGCSSLIPQVNRQEAPSSLGYNRSFTNRKRYVDDKLNFTNHLQSPRSLFLDNNPRDSLSSRRPSFNPSVMNNSLERGPTFSSPFYNGNTTFGGANTAGFHRRGRTLFNSINELQLKVPNRTNIQVKSPNAAGTDSSGMSQTAKRILEALEHFSSPILDAKKIPINANNSSSIIGGKKRQRSEGGAPLARVGLRHLTRELTVPTVPDLLKLKRRQRLQDTTVAARKIVSARSAPPPSPQEYRLRTSDDEKSKYAGKVKTKDKNDLEEDIIADSVNLPNIALPISTLPTFDIMLPVNQTSNNNRSAKQELFTFASPIKVTDTSRNLKSINNFTFSKPIIANEKDSLEDSRTLSKTLSIESNASTLSSSSLSTSNFIWSATSTAPKMREKYKEKETLSDGPKIANSLKTGSVMDILGKKSDPLMDAWKPAAGMWECSQCLIRNAKDEAQCVACKASKSISKVDKSSSEKSSVSSAATISQSKPIVTDCFGSQFKMSSNQWECDACLVRNKQTDIKCVSCTTPRPGGIKPISSTSSAVAPAFVKSDLMEKFKPPKGSWECPGCMLSNPAAIETCPCCNASKPGSLKISPKRLPADSESTLTDSSNSLNDKSAKNDVNAAKDGLWECLSCKVKHPFSTLTCPCSSLTKSGSTGPAFSGFGDKFKKPDGAWTCDDCMIQNQGETSECIACGAAKPGSKKVATKSTSNSTSGSGASSQFSFGIPANTGGFKFGIDKNEEKVDPVKSETPATGFTFGVTSDPPKTSGFTFGVPQNPSGFTFTVTDVDKNKSEANTDDKENTKTETASKKRSLNTEESKNPPTFSFGVPKIEETKPEVAEKKFAFGAPTATANSTAPLFTFGAVKTDAPSIQSNEMPKVSFGIPNTDSSNLNFSSVNEKPSVSLANNQLNVLAKSSDNIDIKPAVNPIFGSTNAVPATISGATVTTTAASAAMPAPFTFGSTTTIPTQLNATPTQTFGQTQAAATPASVPASAMFMFGSSKPANGTATTTTTAPPEKSPALSFGGGNNNGPAFSNPNTMPLFKGSENKPGPVFGVADNKPATLFGGNDTKTPVFGSQDNKIMPFAGSKETITTTFNPPAPAFGVSSTAPAFGSTTPAFGTNSTPIMFAASKPAESAPATANSGMFTFGGNAPQPIPQASTGFNFSGSNPTPAPAAQGSGQKNLFSFGNNSNTQQPGTGFSGGNNFNASTAPDAAPASFAFNAPKPEPPPAFGQTSAPITTPMFGAPQSTSNFGQNQTAPAFGAPTPAPNSGFNFGGAASVAPSGFNFGGQAPAPAAPAGGFTFNAPSPNSGIAFDPNTPPTFNFTGGAPTAFTATPQAAQPRKMKKAVRRAHPR